MERVDVDFVDGPGRSTRPKDEVEVSSRIQRVEQLSLPLPFLFRLEGLQFDDDKVEVVLGSTPLGLPPVSHVLPSARKQQVGARSVVLVGLVHESSSVERVSEVHLSGTIPGLLGSPGRSDEPVSTETS